MAERLRCRVCDHTMDVSEEDPDATVSDMVDHVMMRHGRDPMQAVPPLIEMTTEPDVLSTHVDDPPVKSTD